MIDMRTFHFLLHLLLLLAAVFFIQGQIDNFPDCKSGPLATFPICNQSLPSHQRTIDFISRMTTTEKIAWLSTTTTAIPRLGVPRYEWRGEALHGLAYSPSIQFGGDLPVATSFPVPISMGATFNMRLINRVGSVISTEARAFSNAGQGGLSFFTPNINIVRDPRWGRSQETPGEDPYLTSQYVYALIDGLQRGEDDRYLKIAADCKHLDAYDLEIWNGTDRNHFNAIVSDQDLVETYLPPFETCIHDAQVASIMCSLNSINGIPACANKFFLDSIARHSYHLDGFVVGDCGAVGHIMFDHNYTQTVQDTVAVALHAGTDLECGWFYYNNTQYALDNKTIVESDIDQALERTINVLVRLGWFDPAEQQAYRQVNKSNVNSTEAQQVALDSAQEGLVLLKNLNNSLPLNVDQLRNKLVAFIGPNADAGKTMQGNYHGPAPYLIDPITGFKSVTAGKSINVEHAFGCHISDTNHSGFPAAIELARQADLVIFFGGLDLGVETEGRDRNSIALPSIQIELLQQLEQVVHSPIHVIMMSGSSLDLSFIRDSSAYGSLIWTGYPGQAGGLAIANVLFGLYNPAGRLPITFYPAAYVDEVSMFDMQMRSSPTNPGRTYKFYTGQPVYEFGSGLSFTTFSYAWSDDNTSISSYSIRSLTRKNSDPKQIRVDLFRVNVTNTGSMAGDDVVLCFITPPDSLRTTQSLPIKQLVGFERVHLNVNETVQVFFPLDVSALLLVARDGSRWLHPGLYRIVIGQTLMRVIELKGKAIRWS